MSAFQRTGRRIKLNHSNALPRYLLSISVDKIRAQSSTVENCFDFRFKSATIVSGRFVIDKVIGHKSVTYHDRDQLWNAIFAYTRHNYTTWLVGYNVLTDLILTGLTYRFAAGELHIDRPRSKRTRENNDEEDPHTSALAVLEAPPTVIGCRVGQTQGRLVIVDLRNWFPGELATTVTACGLGQATNSADWDARNMPTALGRGNSEAIHQIFEGLIRFVQGNKLGMFRYTASAQAMSAYRHCRMEHTIFVHDNTDIQKHERRAYFGGRSEVFKKGEFTETMYHLDCNALFPSVMQRGFFPYMLSRFELRPGLLELLPAIDWSASVAHVELQTTKAWYPVRTDAHVIYPIGRFRTWLCGGELYRAFRRGEIKRCGVWAEYKLQQLFRIFVDDLWAMRQQFKEAGNALYEQFTKKIMNSLYGKFAQLTPTWVNVPNDWSLLPFTTESRRDGETQEWTTLRAVGWQTQKLCERKERAGSFYAISAFITSAARARMDFLRLAAGKQNTFYQGVDSLMVNSRGLQNLHDVGEISDTEIGKLRIVAESNFGYINGISDYAIGNKHVLSSRALQSEITDLGDVVQHKYYVMDNLFRSGPIDHIEEHLDAWERRNQYAKGVVQPDGWVEPFVLGASPMSASVGSSKSEAAADAS